MTLLEPWNPKPETMQLVWAAKEFAEAMHPVTVRQVFYNLVSNSRIQNTLREYKNVVSVLSRARLAGFIPFEWIVDLSRRPLKVSLYPDIGAYMRGMVQYYYKDTWANQSRYVMIWLEKEAQQNVVWSVASQYNVPVYPARGYSSHSFILDGAEELEAKLAIGKMPVILYLGDCDPSGQDMPRDLINRLKQLRGIDVELVKVALTQKQVEEYNLPHQPLKKDDPRRGKSGLEYGVELDALDPNILRGLIRQAIEHYLDLSVFDADQELEAREKALLQEKVEEIVTKLREEEETRSGDSNLKGECEEDDRV